MTLSDKKYDLAIVIGRFQILHNGHIQLINVAKGLAYDVLVVIGSCNQPRSINNPFNFIERVEMINGSFGRLNTINISGMSDYVDDMEWVNSIDELVRDISTGNVVIVGHKKDESSFYLDYFPHYDYKEEPNIENISSTELREEFFGLKPYSGLIESKCHPSIKSFLINWKMNNTDTFQSLKQIK